MLVTTEAAAVYHLISGRQLLCWATSESNFIGRSTTRPWGSIMSLVSSVGCAASWWIFGRFVMRCPGRRLDWSILAGIEWWRRWFKNRNNNNKAICYRAEKWRGGCSLIRAKVSVYQRCRDRRAIEIDRDRSIAVVRSRSRSSIAEKKRDRDRDRLVFRSSIAEFDRAKNWQIGNVVLLSKCVQSVVFIVSAEQSSTLKWNRKLIK